MQVQSTSITIRQESCHDKQKANKNVRTLLKTFYREYENESIDKLSLAQSFASGEAIFGDREIIPQWLQRLRVDLKILDMSRSQASATSFLYLNQYPNLREVSFDFCPNMNLVAHVPPHRKIRKVSLLGSTVSLDVLKCILSEFPKLEELSFTVKFPEALRPKVNIPCGCFRTKNERDFCSHASLSQDVLELSVRIEKIHHKKRITVFDEETQALQDGKVSFKDGKFYAEPAEDRSVCAVSVANLARFAVNPTARPEISLHEWLQNIITEQDTLLN